MHTATAIYPKLTDTDSVARACAERPDIMPYTRSVGAWIWVVFPDKPGADTRTFLRDTGFRWNKERNAWQHPCGIYRPRNTRIDPRAYYGERSLSSDLG